MDELDLQCVDKYLNAVRDIVRANPGKVKEVSIVWKRCEPGDCTFPDLKVVLYPLPDALPVPSDS